MHTDPELLALIALGEVVGDDDHRHVATCVACAGDLARLHHVVGLARGAETLTEPGPRVWAGVREGLDVLHEHERSRPRPDASAHARLAPVAGPWAGASGEAELSTDPEGRRLLQVTLRADLPTTGVRQAWLVHRDDPEQRQTLGVLDGHHGLWTVEHAIDLEQYAILEISQEKIGSSRHSGHTIVRGELQLVA